MAGAIGYARVSTEEQAQTNNSLAVQQNRITAYCDQNGLQLLKVFQGSESARTLNRPVLQEMLAYCREHRQDISHVVVTDLSRLSRNVQNQGHIVLTLRQLGIELASIDEPLNENSPLGDFVRNMMGSINQLFSDTLSERTRDRMQAAVKAGRFPWPAPIGYLNRNKKLHVDPVRGPLIREAFELVASGRYVTTDAVLKVVTALGLTTKKGRPVSKQTFARILSNAVYAGWVVSGELRVRGNHEPLVSGETFNAVQTRINTKATPHKKLSEDFPLRGVVRCSTCGRLLTAGFSKGRNDRYSYYWCWTAGCRAVGISRDDLHGKFVSLLSMIVPTAELLAQLPEIIAEQWRERKQRISTDAVRLKARLAEQETLNQRAVVSKIRGELSAEDFETYKKVSAEEKLRIDEQLSALNSEQNTMEEMMRQAEIAAVDLVGTWEKGNVNQRQELAKSFFPEGLVFSHERAFFEPANSVITEMAMRFLKDMSTIGVPDGI